MRAGRLKHPMTLQRPKETAGADGVVVTTWERVADVWAGKLPLGTRESIFAVDSMSTGEQAEIQIRRETWPDLTPAYRFLDGSQVYEIVQVVLDDQRDQVWRCLCNRRAL